MQFPGFLIYFTVFGLVSFMVTGNAEVSGENTNQPEPSSNNLQEENGNNSVTGNAEVSGENTNQPEPSSNNLQEENGNNSVGGQNIEIPTNNSNVEGDVVDNSALARLNNVHSIDDFISLLNFNGRQMTPEDIFVGVDNSTGKMVIQGGGQIAEHDDCSPRETNVPIVLGENDPGVVYFPKCTKMTRCGGCSSTPYLECVPSYTERVSLRVIKAVLPVAGSSNLDYRGFANIILDRHVTCHIQCTLTAAKCGPRKNFLPHQCDCQCKTYERCFSPKLWDPEICSCRCAEEVDCCNGLAYCGLVFNRETCECDLFRGRQHISNQANLTEEEIQAYYESLNNNTAVDAETPSPTTSPTTPTSTPAPTTPTTTTTTTTTTEAPIDPCAGITCPPTFQKIVTSGRCRCRPRIRGSSMSFGRRHG